MKSPSFIVIGCAIVVTIVFGIRHILIGSESIISTTSSVKLKTKLRTDSSTSEPTTPSASFPRKYENCKGTAKERRDLARLGDKANSQDWLDMTRCVRKRESQLVGHFASHVSKSGGTSLCELFKSENCYNHHNRSSGFSGNGNCWITTKNINFKPQWVRSSVANQINSSMGRFKDNAPFCSCNDIQATFAEFSNQKLFMSENYLPEDGVCDKYFMNTIIVRMPMERLISHYNQILMGGTWGKSLQEGVRTFNVTILTKYLDVISDNYYTRSLNGGDVYKSPIGFKGNGDTALQKALESLRKFDWILLVGSGNHDEVDQNNLLLSEGLGLNNGLKISNSHKKKDSYISSFSAEDESFLLKLNRLDSAIWEEAKILHLLDVESLRLMMKYGNNIRKKPLKKKGETCCGNVCSPCETKYC